MLYNELIFFLHSFFVSCAVVFGAYWSKECLISIIALFSVISNAFILKETVLFGFVATCTDSFTIASTVGLNLLHQKYGYQEAQKTVFISFLCLVLYMIVGQIHLAYQSVGTPIINNAFFTLLSTSPRIICASLFVYYISQSIDCILYRWLENHSYFKKFQSKNIISTALSQLVDTVLFSYLALYGVIDAIENIILISYSVKLMAFIISFFCIRMFKNYAFLF